MDAASVDAASVDAASVDAASVDAASVDAARVDAARASGRRVTVVLRMQTPEYRRVGRPARPGGPDRPRPANHPGMTTIRAFESEFRRHRGLAEGAAAQVEWTPLRTPLDTQTNSIAVIMKHVAGNLRSRWTDPWTTDGEKPWRDRDREFIDDFADRAALEAWWRHGWGVLESALASFTDADLTRELRIRGEPHTLALALARSLAHTAYHCGQIVQTARVLASRRGTPWKTLTVPRGGSAAHNVSMGFDPGRPENT
jgi:hypothetical protein